jgi:hypothetical protein
MADEQVTNVAPSAVKVKNRVLDRHSGTGRPIRGEDKRHGSGVGNWGSPDQEIQQGVQQFSREHEPASGSGARPAREPANFGDINEQGDEEQKEREKSFDSYLKERQTKLEPYMTKNYEGQYKKNFRSNKQEKETDLLFQGDQKNKKKRNKKKKQKELLDTGFLYADNRGGRGARGRGRGMGRGDSGEVQFPQRPGGGFGSRGRGRRNENVSNADATNLNENNAPDENEEYENDKNDIDETQHQQQQPPPPSSKPVYRKKEQTITSTTETSNTGNVSSIQQAQSQAQSSTNQNNPNQS